MPTESFIAGWKRPAITVKGSNAHFAEPSAPLP